MMTRNASRLTKPLTTIQNTDSDILANSDSDILVNSESSTLGSLEFTDRTPREILKKLETEGFDSVALIGGSTINGLFAREHLIDEIYITLVPKLFGQGLALLSSEVDMNLELAEMDKIDNSSILLKYNVVKPNS
ncbi:MAG: dihydrofolate reductase family protein [Desulfamplus sp.]|nr:dihydrofolate reductase family protein [Desulfamplus sp.]